MTVTTPSAGVRRRAAADPSGPAVVDADGRTWSWAWLDGRADAMARGLVARTPDRGAIVAASVEPTADGVALVVGAERAARCLVPLPGRLSGRERAEALAEIDPGLVVGDLPGGITVSDLARGENAGAARAANAGPADVSAAVEAEGRPAIGVLTSGTTGRPKVALLSGQALLGSARAWLAALPPATGWLLALGLDHVAGLGVVWRALGAGVPVVMAQAGDTRAILAALAAPPWPSHLSLVPTQLARLLDEAGPVPPPATVRAIPVGGAAPPPALLLRAARAGWPIVPTYGLTEAGSGVSALPTEEVQASPSSAGHPLPGVEIRIAGVDGDGIGAIEIRTAAAFSGYLHRPDQTAGAFTADGWLRTGDLGRLDTAGRLEVVDRRDDLIVSGGENVRPAEVEAVLAEHPAIAEAGVVGRPDDRWGATVVALVVLRAGAADPGDDALRAHCRARLAPWKVPATFVRVPALPRTPSGKLVRMAIRASVLERTRDGAAVAEGIDA